MYPGRVTAMGWLMGAVIGFGLTTVIIFLGVRPFGFGPLLLGGVSLAATLYFLVELIKTTREKERI